MKWPIEPIYEVTKKLEKSWFNGFFDFCGIFRLSKNGKKTAILHCYKMADAKHLLRYSLKYRRKKNSAWLYVLSFDFSQEKYLYVVKGAEIMQIGDAHWKSTCWVDFRKRVEKSVVADGFKKLFESWILKANNPSLG